MVTDHEVVCLMGVRFAQAEEDIVDRYIDRGGVYRIPPGGSDPWPSPQCPAPNFVAHMYVGKALVRVCSNMALLLNGWRSIDHAQAISLGGK
mmetsp:Transcript_18295/g.53330  ORF Transcript_18295/g.53330 Transcript_18295/m.53330 type:complete len:92 (+) Transcript_18295:230-505(+)